MSFAFALMGLEQAYVPQPQNVEVVEWEMLVSNNFDSDNINISRFREEYQKICQTQEDCSVFHPFYFRSDYHLHHGRTILCCEDKHN